MPANLGFVLKSMYENIVVNFYKSPINNGNLTNALAIQLIGYHPKGYGLFKSLPQNFHADFDTEIANLTVKINNKNYTLQKVSQVFSAVLIKNNVKSVTPCNYQVYFNNLRSSKRVQILASLELIGSTEPPGSTEPLEVEQQ